MRLVTMIIGFRSSRGLSGGPIRPELMAEGPNPLAPAKENYFNIVK